MKKFIIIIIIIFASCGLVVAGIAIGNSIKSHKKDLENQRLIQEYRDNKKKIYLEENEQNSDYEVDVCFLGDSLTDGCDVNKYYPDYTVVNRGIGGDTTTTLLNRMDYSVYELKPKVAVVLIGGNNLNTMFDDYEDILIGLKENLPNTKVILVSLTAMGRDFKEKNKIASLNNVKIKLLADQYNYEFVEVFSALYDNTTDEIYSNYTTDGIHLTNEGYLVLTGLISKKIKEVLN